MTRAPVPDISTLREICHAGKVARDPRPIYVLTRRVSIHLTWLVLHTDLRPNQVTLLTVLLGVVGSVLLALPGGGWGLAGSLAFLAHHLVDKVDGDIARFRKIYSIVGVYLDEVGHGLAFAGIFIGLGVHLAWKAAGVVQIAIMTAAALGAIAMVLGRHHKSIGYQLYARNVMDQPDLLPSDEPPGSAAGLTREATQRARENRATGSPLAAIRDLILQLSDFALMVLLILAGAVVEVATGSHAVLRWTLFGEAILQGAVLVALVAVNLTVNVKSEVRRLDRVARALRESPNADR